MALCLLQLELLLRQAATPTEQGSPSDKPNARAGTQSMAFSLTVPEIIDTLREVVGYFFRQARAARDEPARAQALRTSANDLRVKAFNDKGVTDDIVFIQVEGAKTAAGLAGLRLMGTNGQEETVTPLVGNPRMDQIKSNPYVESGMGIVGILYEQEHLIDDLMEVANVRAELKDGGALDLQSRALRAKVWAALYRAYAQTPPIGGSGKSALDNTLVMMRRYLASFTIHSWMNIRDDGPSYLDKDMPQDILGRFVQDCGVYSVTMAYDFYLLGRAVGMQVESRFVLTVDHSMLQVVAANGESYGVSNDDVFGPVPEAEIEEQLAKAVGRVYSRDVVLAPCVRTKGVSSTLPDGAFRRTLWEQWGYTTKLDINADLQRLPMPRYKGSIEDLRRQFHQDLVDYDAGSRKLHALVDALQNVPMSALNSVQRSVTLTPLVLEMHRRLSPYTSRAHRSRT